MNGIFGHKPTPGQLFSSHPSSSSLSLRIDIVPNDGQFPPHREHHQKYLLATGPMCRYAVDLQPMLKVLAGPENIDRLLNIDTPVRYFIE